MQEQASAAAAIRASDTPCAITSEISAPNGQKKLRESSWRKSPWWRQRYLVHADYLAADWFRVFGQLQGVFEDGRSGGPRPTDRGGFDVHELFFDIAGTPLENSRLTFRLGRQELSYGSERLVSAREGTNSRRAFDAARLLFHRDNVQVDAFVGAPVEVDDDSFDDQDVRDLWFWGLYATFPLTPAFGANLDAYYLGLHNPHGTFSQGVGREERHTFGVRLFGKTGRFDFDNEAMYQFGRFGSGDIQAWSSQPIRELPSRRRGRNLGSD